MNLAIWLERTALKHPNREALFLGHKCIGTYKDFWLAVCALRVHLEKEGIKRGDRVAVYMPNCPEFLVAFYSVWSLGAVILPINSKLHMREVKWILGNAECTYLLGDAVLASELNQPNITVFTPKWDHLTTNSSVSPVLCSSDDLAWLFYTSGTTGKPKGVMITHGMIKTMALSYFADVDQVHPTDTTLYAAPMSHGAGLYSIMHVQAGARHAIPVSGGFDEDEIFDLAEKLQNIHMFAAPTMVKRLTNFAKKSNKRGNGFRTVVYAGGPMYLSDIIEAVEHFGPIFVQVYGQGECPMGITVLPRYEVADRKSKKWKERLQSVGYAQSAVEVKIGNKNGATNKPGETGEIMVRGDIVMPGYWGNIDATSKTIIDGWLMTGDIGTMDEHGYVTMHDRSKDMIISGGSNIYPREVEEILLLHKSVSEVSVVGRENEEWGEEVVAFIVMEKGHEFLPETLDQHCLEHIARFKRPKHYISMAELPKNNYGKILKTTLREKLKQNI